MTKHKKRGDKEKMKGKIRVWRNQEIKEKERKTKKWEKKKKVYQILMFKRLKVQTQMFRNEDKQQSLQIKIPGTKNVIHIPLYQ